VAGGQRPALSHLDGQRVRPVGAMARRRLGASPPAAPNGAAEGLLAPHGLFRPPLRDDSSARAHRPRAGGMWPHACPQPGRARPGWRQRCRSARRCIGERRVPLKAVAPVRIRSGLPSTTSTTRPLTCTTKVSGRLVCPTAGRRSVWWPHSLTRQRPPVRNVSRPIFRVGRRGVATVAETVASATATYLAWLG
jgi:hypothetical protein